MLVHGAAGPEQRACGPPFPRLREFVPVAESLRSVAPRVVLGAGEQAVVYFVYNGTPVDSRRLRDGDETVRFVADAVLYEIPRDLAAEASFRSQLGELPSGRVRVARIHDEPRAGTEGAGLERRG